MTERCAATRVALDAWPDRALDGKSERHVAECPDCGRMWRACRRVADAMAAIRAEPVPARLQGAPTPVPLGWPARIAWAAAGAAVVALANLGLAWAAHVRPVEAQPDPTAVLLREAARGPAWEPPRIDPVAESVHRALEEESP